MLRTKNSMRQASKIVEFVQKHCVYGKQHLLSLSEAKLHTNLVEQGAGNTHGVKTPTVAVSLGMPPGRVKVVRRSLGRLGTLLPQRFGWFWAGHTPGNDCLSLTLNSTSSPESLSSSIMVSGIPTTCSPFTSPWWDQSHQKERQSVAVHVTWNGLPVFGKSAEAISRTEPQPPKRSFWQPYTTSGIYVRELRSYRECAVQDKTRIYTGHSGEERLCYS